jgi:hypothetical protein
VEHRGPVGGEVKIESRASAGWSLLPGETLAMASSDGMLAVTNQRVVYRSEGFGYSRSTSMTLDAVASCGYERTSQPALLVFAVLSLIGAGAASHDRSALAGALFAAVFFFILYFASQTSVLLICSQGGERIRFDARGTPASMLSLLHAVDAAKANAQRR